MSQEQAQSFLSLAIGFAVAGLLATSYELVTRRPASFQLLQRQAQGSIFAAVPLIAFAAPFIIMRNVIRARSAVAGAGERIRDVMLATIIAGFWSLISGTILAVTLLAIRIPAGLPVH